VAGGLHLGDHRGMRYRRTHLPGATVFLTLVTRDRLPRLQEAAVRTALRDAVSHVRQRHAFTILAHVVLPDHCHLLWRLPEDDGDFSLRVRLIKHHMARQPDVPAGLWQGRFWDHLIRDEADLQRHLDYIHFNPVKHGYVATAAEWPDSSFAAFVTRGMYAKDWGVDADVEVGGE
jgi:putative transposase